MQHGARRALAAVVLAALVSAGVWSAARDRPALTGAADRTVVPDGWEQVSRSVDADNLCVGFLQDCDTVKVVWSAPGDVGAEELEAVAVGSGWDVETVDGCGPEAERCLMTASAPGGIVVRAYVPPAGSRSEVVVRYR